MAKMKFLKMFAFVLCMIMIPVFAGCSLITNNLDKQLNEVVVDYNNSQVTVTREELINTYRNIYSSSTSAPTEETVEDALNLALNRKIWVNFLTADDMETERTKLGVKKVVLTTYQSNEIWQNVYDYINSAVKSYETEDRTAKNQPYNQTTSTEEEKDYSYTPYEKKYTYEGNGVLTKVENDAKVANKSIALITEADKDLSFTETAKKAYDTFRQNYWHYTDSILLNDKATNTYSFSDKAWSDWINQLLRNENERNLSKVDAEAFWRQIKKVYDVYYQNAILTAWQEDYEADLTLTGNMVLDKFTALYDAQKELFDTDEKLFTDKIPTKAEALYYVKNPNDFFRVNHLLVKFNEEQTKAIEDAKTRLTNLEISLDEYNIVVNQIKANTKAYNRDTKEYEPVNKVLEDLTSELSNVNVESERFAIFRKYMHRYSEDTATLNAEACYYIPVDAKKNADVMEKAFADGSRKLYQAGVVGSISSSFVETTYGYHIIMYTGTAQSVTPSSNVAETLANLNKYKINPLYNKTLLDKVIEQITLTSFSDYQNGILDALKENKTIVYNKAAYSDLYS